MKDSSTVLRLLRGTAALSIAIALGGPGLLARPKTDVIVMDNGDRITCEIKGLDKGQLSIKTDYTIGTISVDWAKVVEVESAQRFQYELQDGRRYTGSMKDQQHQTERDTVQLELTDESTTEEVVKEEVVAIQQMDQGFVGKLDGSVDYGFDFTRANNQTSSTLNSSVKYRSEKNIVALTISSRFSGQTDAESTNRNNATLSYQRYLRLSKWFSIALVDFLQSDQQDLDLRTTFGGGLGHDLKKTNRSLVRILGGAVVNREKFSVDMGFNRKTNAEGLVGLDYSTFQFDSTEVTAKLLTFPSLSDGGRVRVSFDAGVKLDLVGDLYWNASPFWHFDSRPPANTERHDFGISTTVGWSF